MRRVILATSVLAAALVAPATAHADYFTVRLDTVEILQGGDVAATACTATAETSVAGWVPASTSVGCRIDATSTTSRALGPKAVAVVASPVGPSYLVCVSGAATFVSARSRVFVAAAEQCTAYDH